MNNNLKAPKIVNITGASLAMVLGLLFAILNYVMGNFVSYTFYPDGEVLTGLVILVMAVSGIYVAFGLTIVILMTKPKKLKAGFITAIVFASISLVAILAASLVSGILGSIFLVATILCMVGGIMGLVRIKHSGVEEIQIETIDTSEPIKEVQVTKKEKQVKPAKEAKPTKVIKPVKADKPESVEVKKPEPVKSIREDKHSKSEKKDRSNKGKPLIPFDPFKK